MSLTSWICPLPTPVHQEYSPASWVDSLWLPIELAPRFNELWDEHPAVFARVIVYGIEHPTPRWSQSYGRAYIYSGVKHEALPIPSNLAPLVQWANGLGYPGSFNQVMVNWYESGLHYIGKHSDSEAQLIPGLPIVSISLGAERKFRIRDKQTGAIVSDIPLPNLRVLVMGGAMQREFTHEVPKMTGRTAGTTGRRINITFRQFRDSRTN
jgi:alkylated DNA repair dioxygenase AlkB